jgi:hypothetical protein
MTFISSYSSGKKKTKKRNDRNQNYFETSYISKLRTKSQDILLIISQTKLSSLDDSLEEETISEVDAPIPLLDQAYLDFEGAALHDAKIRTDWQRLINDNIMRVEKALTATSKSELSFSASSSIT